MKDHITVMISAVYTVVYTQHNGKSAYASFWLVG